MQITDAKQVPGALPAVGPEQLSAPTKVDVKGDSISISGKWLGAGNPAALVVRRDGTNEKKGFLFVLGFGRAGDEITVTYHLEGLAPGKYVAALVFDNPRGPQAKFAFEYGPKMQTPS